MDWMIPFQALPAQSRKDPGLSERLLRHLFLPRQIRAGKRVLDFGCENGELTRFLDSQSIHVVGCDTCAASIAKARRKAPHLSYFCVDPGDRLPVPDHEFDLVLARGLAAHAGDLCGQESLIATAHLLATLKPGGELVIVQRSEVNPLGQSECHLRSCFARHVGAFPGVVKVSIVADTIFEQKSISRLFGLRPASGFVTASLKLGPKKISRDEWREIAERELSKRTESCCEWGAARPASIVPAARAA